MDAPSRTDTATKPERRSGLRSASTLLGLPLVATIFIATIRSVRHFGEGWPTHAEHHLVAFMAVAVGTSVVGLLLVAKPLRQGEVWAWWALLVTGAAIFGGFLIGEATVGLGHDATVPNTAQVTLTTMYLIGLAAGWRIIHPSTHTSLPVSSGHRPPGI